MNEPSTAQQNFRSVTLGLTGPQISLLGTGTWQWGDEQIWGFGKGEFTEADLRASFQASLEAGINFFDTAEVYGGGRSESFLGQFLRDVPRERVVIATKFMPHPYRLTRSSLLSALRRSLARLELKQVDLYQVHWPYPPMPVEHWAEALADAAEAGFTRAVGVSNYDPSQMSQAYDTLSKRGIHLSSNQVRYNLLDRRPEKSGLLRICQELGVTLIAYSPLAQGLLTGKYSPDNPPAGLRRWMHIFDLPRLPELVDTLQTVGAAHDGKTPGQVALNWLIRKGAVPIPGAKNAHQVAENAGALGWQLSDDEMDQLDEVSGETA